MLDDLLSNPWAYLPPRSSLWLWVGGPILVFIVYFLTKGNAPARKRRLREAEIWRRSLVELLAVEEGRKGAPYRPGPTKGDAPKKTQEAGPTRVSALPSSLGPALVAVGGGEPIAHYELVRDLAYLSLVESSLTAGSDYQTVTLRLEEKGPTTSVRPLPLVDGARVQNGGIQFRKDPELMERFLVEGADAKAIGRFLSEPIRRALCKVPDAWVTVVGNTMTVTVFGALEADQIDALVELADEIFAEHGAEGGPSLFGDDLARAPAPPRSKPAEGKKQKAAPAGASTLAETPSSKKRG